MKNMDDILMGAPDLEYLEAMMEEFLQSCHAKNIKLKGTKFVISRHKEVDKKQPETQPL